MLRAVLAGDVPLGLGVHDFLLAGGSFALAAARALIQNTELDARTIVEKSLNIAADICIYTNRNLTIEELKG